MGMPNRLSHFDYSQPGYYFITICTKNHHPILRRGAQCAPAPLPPLTSAGLAAERFLLEIPVHYPMISVDHYVVMPNHVHLILVITAGHIGTDGRTVCAPTVSRVVRGWKEAVTKQIGVSIWQKSFHDHIIRNETDYLRIWNYIDTNPAKWREDCYYNDI